MNNLVALQLLGLIDPNLDELEMTKEDAKYVNNNRVQKAIKDIKIMCLKSVLLNNFDIDMLALEFKNISEELDTYEKEYLESYMKNLLMKMQDVINKSEQVEEKTVTDDTTWHWGDEIAPGR